MSVSDQILHLRQLTLFPSLGLVSLSMLFPLSVSYLVCCKKICRDKARGVVVLPDQPNQPWYAAVARMLVKKPVLVSARNNLLCLPQLPEEKHWLVKLRLIICEISGADSESQDFRTQLFQLCAPHGALGLRRDMPQKMVQVGSQKAY